MVTLTRTVRKKCVLDDDTQERFLEVATGSNGDRALHSDRLGDTFIKPGAVLLTTPKYFASFPDVCPPS